MATTILPSPDIHRAGRRAARFCDRRRMERGGVITRAQLHAAGWTDGMIRAQLDADRWQRVHPGVYATHTGPLGREAQIWGAILLAGDGAVASHQTAAELWGFLGVHGSEIHVSLPRSRRATTRAGIVVHTSTYLSASRHPVAAPPRTRVEATVLDLIDTAPSFPRVIEAVTAACQPRLTTVARLRRELHGRVNPRWRQAAADVLADVGDGAQTPLELAYLRRVERAHGLPVGRRQRHHRAGRYVQWIDVDYVDYQTRVELDGRVGHVGEGRFRDRRRDNRSTVEGRNTLRYGWIEVMTDSCGVAAEAAVVLGYNGWRGVFRPCGTGCQLMLAAA